ncbi:MAG: DUF3830 family protein [Candidatus Bathyarchaeia archaeon]
MEKKMEIEIPELGVSSTAILLEENTPKTCEVIWDSLPIRGYLIYNKWCGQQLIFNVRDSALFKIPKENPTNNVRPRDVTYWYSYWDYPGMIRGVDEHAEIGIVWLRDAKPWYVWGEQKVNVFAEVISNFSRWSEVAKKVRFTGAKEVILKKTDEGVFDLSKIEITVPSKNVRAVAELLEEEAPKTCEAVLEFLPAELEFVQCSTSGAEVIAFLEPPDIIRLPPENWVRYVLPGDVAYYYGEVAKPGTYMGDSTTDFAEIVIYYDRDCRFTGDWGGVNLFARITENFEGISNVCKEVQFEGAVKMIWRKLEE